MKKGYIGVATNRALSVAHCAKKKKKKKNGSGYSRTVALGVT